MILKNHDILPRVSGHKGASAVSQSFTAFVLHRALRAFITLWLVGTVVFVFLRLSGDPARLLLPPEAPQQQLEELRRDLGLDDPLPVQYARYVGNVARGDFGDSLRQRQPALGLVLDRFPLTLQLGGMAFLLAAAIGPPVGLLAAVARGTAGDRLAMALMSLLQASPAFFLGTVLVLLFSVRLGWLPSSGHGTPQQMVLPALTLTAALLASMARLARAALLDVLRTDYIRTARAKGLSELSIFRTHALRNAAPPLVTILGVELGWLLTGAVIVETVFAWPGLGRLTVDAVSARDYPLVQAAVLLIAAVFVALSFLVDCSYGLIDPRVRDA
jgi:ABC-type dipeptide/oligopeptide/nickel transport system permease component